MHVLCRCCLRHVMHARSTCITDSTEAWLSLRQVWYVYDSVWLTQTEHGSVWGRFDICMTLFDLLKQRHGSVWGRFDICMTLFDSVIHVCLCLRQVWLIYIWTLFEAHVWLCLRHVMQLPLVVQLVVKLHVMRMWYTCMALFEAGLFDICMTLVQQSGCGWRRFDVCVTLFEQSNVVVKLVVKLVVM